MWHRTQGRWGKAKGMGEIRKNRGNRGINKELKAESSKLKAKERRKTQG
jgi:hypothetical protein